ncbi:hypothetical protein ACFFKC_08690 [Pseudoduganella danionis]|uniref:Uncharacterized protein n=1 Tax=Pseudoduganella danionis TaxID=1890295 RepID=A0ABW9SRT9_9BURK|nr:hypothetical protein [Pseudoduganella danionis]MTW34846.1 hypothetical protein [Pseudoduganella danionis]
MKLTRLTLCTLLLALSTARAADAPATAAAAAPATPPSVTFLDSTLFDNMLSRELNKGTNEVEVVISGKMSLNNIPPRVDKWITAVAEEGEVTLKPVDNALKPKFVLALLPVVYSFLKQSTIERQVSVAAKYNAAVVYHIDKNSGESVIDKIVFQKKAQ